MLAERRDNEEFDHGTDQAWLWSNARCNDGTGNLVALFFSEQLDDIARAKAFCAGCAVEPMCANCLPKAQPCAACSRR